MKRKNVLLATPLLCMMLGAAVPALAQLNGSATSAAGEPYNVVARSYPSATQAVVTWSSTSPAATGFRVERRIVGSRAWLLQAQVAADSRSHVDSNLLLGTAYEYRVSAVRADGSVLSSTGQVILTTPTSGNPADYTAAAAPRRLSAQPMNSGEITLEWQDASPDETAFRIERKDPGQDWRAVASVAANATLYRDRNLQAGTNYQYRVSAVRPSGVDATSLAAPGATPAAGVNSIFYVDPAAGNDSNPGTEARPFKTLQKAHDVMLPGHTVLARKGTYTLTWNYTVLMIRNSGLEGAPITYRNYPGERPLIKTTKGKNHHGIEVRDAAWIVIDGFEVEGHVNQVTYDEAKYENDLSKTYWQMSPRKYIGATVDSNGISLAGKTLGKTHHIVVRNNIVHDTPGGGIAAGLVDYVTIENNRVYNTSAYSPYGTSGISYLVPYNHDTNTQSYKLVVMNNVVSGASNLFPCECYQYRQQTDGNGIIIDSFNSRSYTGRTLVANNIVYDNGGRGIHSFNSRYLDVFNNTTYRNGKIQITGEGEISVQGSKFVRVWNNIFVASADRPVSNYFNSTDTEMSHNIVYGGNRWHSTIGTNNRIGVDPRFVAVTGPYAFQLAANSPAVNTAYNAGVPSHDVYGAPRPRGAAADVGAVESL